MSKKNILLAITNGLWLIDAQSAAEFGFNISQVLSGEKFWNENHKAKAEFLITEPKSTYFSSSLKDAKPNSVAVISISGPIMKEDNCGDAGTKTYESLLSQAASNPNITGIVLQIDSPGGTVSGTQSLSDLIKSIDKPVVTLAEDLMASAAYWIGSSADYIFANTGTTRVGSIGTMISFSDMQPVWEKMGAKFHEVYASASTKKNADIAEARKGNYDALIKNTLDPLNNEFLNSVKANRGIKLNAEQTLNGQVYTANDALKYGLVDAIGNLQNAIDKVYSLAAGETTPQQILTQNTQNPNNMKKITLMASHAAILALCGATLEAGAESVEVEMTDEILSKINEAITVGAKAKTDLETANESLKAAQTAATEKDSIIAGLKTDNKVLSAKVSTLDNAGATKPVKEGADDLGAETKETYLSDIDEKLAAQKAALSQDFK